MESQPYSELSDLALLELCVWREARNQPLDGMRAVANVIRNRVYNPDPFNKRQWWGNDWHSVILHPWQFSSFNELDPNVAKWPSDTDPSFGDVCQVSTPIFMGVGSDNTNGALWYKVTKLPWPHNWGPDSGYQRTLEIGAHSFYKKADVPVELNLQGDT